MLYGSRRKNRGLLPLLLCWCLWYPQGAGASAPAVKGYADYLSYSKRVAQIAASSWATHRSLAKTRDGRDVFLLTVGKGNTAGRPALLIVGNVHEPHLAGSELAVKLADELVTRAEKKDKAVTDLLNRYTIYIIPRPNPDGSEAFFKQPHFERAGNSRPTDDDRDGNLGEDPFNDLNGDGAITMMRIEDPAGEYIKHPNDPRVLIKADPKKNERGKYRLLTEGIDDDHDGQFNEDNSVGVSFNHNFTFKYPYFKQGAGPHQVSEPETRAVADFAFDRPNIVAVFTFSLQDNLFHPWKPNGNSDRSRIKTHIHSKDAPYQDSIAKLYRETHSGKDAPNASGGDGSFSEWAYFHYGRWSFATQGWWMPKVSDGNVKRAKQEAERKEGDDSIKPVASVVLRERRGIDDITKLRWLELRKIKGTPIDGFVNWTRVKHPDFPGKKVEVGGFKPYLFLNPPIAELDPLVGKQIEFLSKLSDQRPKLSIREVEDESLGEGVHRLTVTVSNEGRLPTMTEMGRITRDLQGVQLELTLPKGAKLITGHPRSQLNPLAGNGGSTQKVWLLRAPKGGSIQLRTWSPLVGTATKTIQLKEAK